MKLNVLRLWDPGPVIRYCKVPQRVANCDMRVSSVVFVPTVHRSRYNWFQCILNFLSFQVHVTHILLVGVCKAGYYCISRATSSSPIVTDERGGPCPQGYYCPEASSHYTPCPKGTFGDRDRLGSEIDCTWCPPGEFCALSGMTAPNGSCVSGHYCSNRLATPSTSQTLWNCY